MKVPTLASCVCTIAVLSLPPATAFADTSSPLSDFTMTSWSRRDGIAAPIWSICQDKDGYLWIGTASGLVRFDGHRFVRLESLGIDNARVDGMGDNILALLSARDGSLWIGAGTAGIGRLLNGKLTFYRDTNLGNTRSLVEDRRGDIWAGSRNGLYRFEGGRWVLERVSVGLPAGPSNIYEAQDGALWVVTRQGTYRRLPSRRVFEFVPNPPSLPGGPPTRWMAERANESAPEYRLGLLRDSRGNFWIPSLGQGLTRTRLVAGATFTEHVTTNSGLSSDVIGALYEDREANIWIGTQAALHALTPRKVKSVNNLGTVTGVETTADGSTWFASAKGLIRITKNRRSMYTQSQGLPPGQVWTLARDRRDRLWITTDRASLALFSDDRFKTVIPRDDRITHVDHMSIDSADTVWLRDFQFGIMRLQDGILTPLDALARLDRHRPVRVHVDHADRVWLGFENGHVGLLGRDGQITVFSLGLTGAISAMYEDRDRILWIGAENGVARFANGQSVAITNEMNGVPGLRIKGIIDDKNGALWTATSVGIVRVEKREFDAVAASPSHRVRYVVYDETDGLQGVPGSLNSPAAARAADGRLWFVTDSGATVIDPDSLPPARPAPAVRIEVVHAGSDRFNPTAPFRLPPHPERLDIEYTALTFAAPMTVRFRYRLNGFDSDWQDADTRRQVSYTNLPPGDYKFQVVVLDKEGSFDQRGAVLDFSVAPALYQTTWFPAAVAISIVALSAVAWRIRVRQIRLRFSLVFGERTRISREVHDTLLQSLIGVALRSGTISTRLPADPLGARERLDQMREDVELQIREVRQTIWNLRSPTLESRGLAGAIEDAGHRIARQMSASFTFRVVGRPQSCEPDVEEQILRIAQEALINAGRHSGASELHAELQYDADSITLNISDNGVGFNVDTVPRSSERHFGLSNMRERAREVGGQFEVVTLRDGGTRVVASFPVSMRGIA